MAKMSATGSFFVTVSCVIRRYVYREVWNPNIGVDFISFAEKESIHSRKAVAVNCIKG